MIIVQKYSEPVNGVHYYSADLSIADSTRVLQLLSFLRKQAGEEWGNTISSFTVVLDSYKIPSILAKNEVTTLKNFEEVESMLRQESRFDELFESDDLDNSFYSAPWPRV